jgi:hypothetical protein
MPGPGPEVAPASQNVAMPLNKVVQGNGFCLNEGWGCNDYCKYFTQEPAGQRSYGESRNSHMNVELVEFTRQALAKGLERKEIADTLQRAGWAEYDINAAMNAFADVAFPVPVPRPKPYLSAREVFVYLILFATLYVAVGNIGTLIFELIDRSFPDPLVKIYIQASNATIRWNISWIIIAFPLFIFTFRSVTRAIAQDPTKRGSRPRKWLTYLTLFAAGAFLVGDAATLVYNLLGGEFTIRFVLKVATIALLAGGIFIFFLTDMREDVKPQSATRFAVPCTIVACAAVIAGWVFIGLPGEIRLSRLDATRAGDLASISNAIANYRSRHEHLPGSFDELQQSQPNLTLSFRDPVGQAYEYAVKDAFAYELCASFDRATDIATEPARARSLFETHGAGRQCFNLEARPPAQR